MTNFALQDKVIYARGAKGTLIGKNGIIVELYVECGYPFATVQFDGMGSYPCLILNLDKL